MSDGRVVIDSTLNDDGLKRGIKKLEAQLGKLGGSFGRVSKLASGISLSSSIIPAVGALTGAVGGLTSSLVAASGAFGAFGLAAIGNIKQLTNDMGNLADINKKIQDAKQAPNPDQKKINQLLNERAQIMSKMSKPEQQAVKQVNQFKEAWKGFTQATQEPVFDVTAKALNLTANLLKKIEPIVKPTAKALGQLLQQMNDFANTKEFKSFINFFATRGADALKNWGQVAGNTFVGIMELMKGFGPLGQSMEQWFVGITDKFKNWSKTVSSSKGFQAFLDYTKTNGKMAMDVLGNLFQILAAITKALSPLGEVALSVFKDLSGLIVALLNGKPIDGFINSLTQSIPKLVQTASKIVMAIVEGIIQNLPAILNAALKIVITLIKGFIQALPQIVTMALQLMTVLTNFIVQNLPMIINTGTKMLLALVNGVVKMMPVILPAVIKIIMALVTAVLDNLPKIIDAGIKVLNALIDGLISVMPQLIDATIRLLAAVIEAIITHLPEIIAAGVRLIAALVVGLIKALPRIWTMIGRDLIPGIYKQLSKINLFSIGKAVMKGFVKGLTSLGIPVPHFTIKGSWDLNPAGGMHFPHPAFAGWYADGAVFPANSPRLIGVGDASVPEAALPLKPSVLGMIGQKIADNMPTQPQGLSFGSDGPLKAVLRIDGHEANGVLEFVANGLGNMAATAARG